MILTKRCMLINLLISTGTSTAKTQKMKRTNCKKWSMKGNKEIDTYQP